MPRPPPLGGAGRRGRPSTLPGDWDECGGEGPLLEGAARRRGGRGGGTVVPPLRGVGMVVAVPRGGEEVRGGLVGLVQDGAQVGGELVQVLKGEGGEGGGGGGGAGPCLRFRNDRGGGWNPPPPSVGKAAASRRRPPSSDSAPEEG